MRSGLFGRLVVVAVLLVALGCAASAPPEVLERTSRFDAPVPLPPIDVAATDSLSNALSTRRSVREYSPQPLDIDVIGQLFWAAQGVTDARGHRTAPSAGGRYPLEVYAITSNQVLHYLPPGHAVESRADDRVLASLADAAFGQEFVSTAPAVVVISAVVARTEQEYGAVAPDLVNREAGHAAQNVLLQATALDLAHVPVGGFDPARVADLLALPPGEEPLYLIPIGQRLDG